MPRYIDADLLIKGIDRVLRRKRKGSPAYVVFSAMIGLVDAVPTADVAEVVRCKDCNYWTGTEYDGCCIKNGLSTRYAKDFCSYGERKERKRGGVPNDPTERRRECVLRICWSCIHEEVCRQWRDTDGDAAASCGHFEEIRPPVFGEWIDAEKRLPPADDDSIKLVIVNGRFGNVCFDRAIQTAWYTDDEGWILEAFPRFENPNVTHWMELPEAADADRNDEKGGEKG